MRVTATAACAVFALFALEAQAQVRNDMQAGKPIATGGPGNSLVYGNPPTERPMTAKVCDWLEGWPCLRVNSDGSLPVIPSQPSGPLNPNLVFGLARDVCTAASTTNPALTVTPPAGNYVYINAIYGSVTTGTSAPSAETGIFSLSNMLYVNGNSGSGTATTMQWGWTVPATADVNIPVIQQTFYPPIRSVKAGVAVGMNGTTGAANVTQCVSFSYAFGP